MHKLNCGLTALEKITKLETASMFTLIHLAKDNGINLYFCNVEPEELVKVARPAIFHQDNHYVFVKDGDPMPAGDYDGYVLTPKPINEPLPYSLAKKIRGQKKASGFIAPVATGLGFLLGGPIGAGLAGAAVGGLKAGGVLGKEGKGEWWRIATGGLSGATMGAAPLISGLSAAAGELPGAIKSGNWMAPIGAGLGQYGAATFAGGARAGLEGASGGIFNKLGGAAKGGIQALTGGAQRLAGGGGTPGVSVGTEIARGGIGTIPAGDGGSYTVPGIGNRVVGIPGIAGPSGYSAGAMNLAGGLKVSPTPGASGGNLLQNIFGGGASGGLSGKQLLGMGASSLISPPKLQGDITSNYSKAATYLGGENYKSLPSATRKQLEEYVNTPLDQLAGKFVTQNDKGMRLLEERHQEEKDQLLSQYANYGQDPYTSTEAQQRLTELDRQYDQAKGEYQQQIQNQAMQQAVSFKKEMLQNAMQQGQFDYESAMELATNLGRDQEMKFAFESKNYEMLQNLLAEIFSR